MIGSMKEQIMNKLEQANEKEIRLIYFYTMALMKGKDGHQESQEGAILNGQNMAAAQEEPENMNF